MAVSAPISSSFSVAHLSRAFGPTTVLDDITLSLSAGEIVGILGENGAGKSTLLNILSGTLQPSSGAMSIDGEPRRFRDHNEANRRGVWRIFQEPAQIGPLPVYENLFLGHERHFARAGVLDTGAMIRAARVLVEEQGLAVDVRDPVLRYDFATRQALEVGRAILLPRILGLPASFILFDEPTTGLTRAEVDRLLDRMRVLRGAGAGLAFVSHRLPEVFAVCDRVLVLRDGRLVGGGPTADFDEDRLHRLMVGRALAAPAGKRSPRTLSTTAGPILSVRNLGLSSSRTEVGRRRLVDELCFSVAPGEIVGIGGLLGSGKTETLRLLAGIGPSGTGEMTLDGQPLLGSIARRKRRGLSFVPSDRTGEAIIPASSVARNISLPSGEAGARGFSTRLGVWRTAYERRISRSLIKAFNIKATPDQPVGTLSGGNQQKVSLARWIHREPLLLLIENPTAGVDVGAKNEIHCLLRALADRRTAILFVSDDLPELIGLADRILLLRDGRLVADIDNAAHPATEHALVATMIGPAPSATVSALASTTHVFAEAS